MPVCWWRESYMVTVITVVVVALVAAVIAYAIVFPGDYRVSESLTMAVPREKAYGLVADLKSWPKWSPWVMHEPELELAYSDDPAPDAQGGNYSWKGKKMGIGKVTHVNLKEAERIEQRIEFLKPFKSASDITWTFEYDGGKTKVTWTMEGRVPFFFRFLAGMIKRMVSSDYRLGLKMLEREADPEAPRFGFEFSGVSDCPATRCVYESYKGNLAGLKEKLPDVFPKLAEAAKDESGKPAGMPMGVCVKMDEKNDHIEYEAAVPTTKSECDLPVKEYPASTCNKVVLRGSYDLLPLAWHVAFANTHMNKLKFDKGRPPFEVYENDPTSVASPDEILTSIHIPVKT